MPEQYNQGMNEVQPQYGKMNAQNSPLVKAFKNVSKAKDSREKQLAFMAFMKELKQARVGGSGIGVMDGSGQ